MHNDEQTPPPRRRRSSRRLLWWTAGIVVVCGIAGLLLATLFEGATVSITPKSQQITSPGNIVAFPNAPTGSLSYQTITLTRSATTSAQASGTQHVSTQASGVITIYNSYSTAPQQLVATTRFEAGDGKIYRIHAAVTVPGQKKNTDGSMTPGSVVATVYADAAGDSYNRTDATTFTIPGFKNDPRYTKFSAQSQGAISGGFVGDKPAVSSTDMHNAQTTLKTQIDQGLQAAIDAQIPTGYMQVQGSLQTTYNDVVSSAGEGSNVSLSESATASVAIVSGDELAGILAKLLVSGYNGEPVTFASPNPLSLQLATSSGKTGALTILLQGNPTIVWTFDQNALKDQLLGKSKDTFQTVVHSFEPAIEKAEAHIRPFWKATFPTDADKLDIEVVDSSN